VHVFVLAFLESLAVKQMILSQIQSIQRKRSWPRVPWCLQHFTLAAAGWKTLLQYWDL